MNGFRARSRSAVVAVLVLSGTTTTSQALVQDLGAAHRASRGWAPADANATVAVVCEVLLLLALAWACLACLVVVAEVWSGATAGPRRAIPHALRRLILTACGVAALGAVATGPAHAEDPVTQPGLPDLSGLSLPARTVDPYPDPWLRPAAAQAAPHGIRAIEATSGAVDHSPGSRHHVVSAGESLWSIAAERLPTGAGDDEVATAWHALWRANRGLIGPSPDVIEPGQSLVLPPPLSEGSR